MWRNARKAGKNGQRIVSFWRLPTRRVVKPSKEFSLGTIPPRLICRRLVRRDGGAAGVVCSATAIPTELAKFRTELAGWRSRQSF